MATDFLFQAGPYGDDELLVLRFTGSERMSQPFWYDVTLSGKDLTVDFEEMIGSDACLRLSTPEGERFVHGIVARWEEGGSGKHGTTYEATVVPRLWTLSLRRSSRIFQDLTTKDIVSKVLAGSGFTSDQFRFSLQGSYKPRTYCVQYRETDLDFVSRLLEEEGMFYFFEQTEDGHLLVIADSNDACVPIPGNDALVFREGNPGMQGTEQVTRLRWTRSLRIAKVSMLEFDFKKPSLDQTVTETSGDADKEARFVSEDFPGEYPEPGLGSRLAKVRLEEQRAEAYLGVGETDCRRLSPGWRFSLEEHPNEEANRQYLVVAARFRGIQPRQDFQGMDKPGTRLYLCTFECTPSEVAYRAPRITPRPRLDGLQTAVVVGPKGEEIHCDEFGRVKVKFPWDRSSTTDDKASCWIRASQQWGGGGYGSMFIPRIGQEVVVEFLEGDPDRPLITGRVYNGGSPVPYELPAQKIITTMQSSTSPGGRAANELRMNDAAAAEELFVNASKDHNSKIENDRHLKVKINETVTVNGNVTRTVEKEEKVEVEKNRNEVVASDQSTTIKGDDLLDVKGGVSRSIGSIRLRFIKGDSTLKVDGSNGRTVGVILMEMIKGDSKREVGGNTRMNAGIITAEMVKGDHKEESDDERKVLVGGVIMKKTKGDMEKESKGMVVFASATIMIKAKEIEIEGKDKIALMASGSALVMESGDISLEASKIDLKSSGAMEAKGTMIPAN